MQETYELMLILPAEMDEPGRKKFFDQIATHIKQDGKIADTKDFGKRRLAYPIKKQIEGNYWLLTINGNGKAAKTIAQRLTNNEAIIRYLLTTSEKVKLKKGSTKKEETVS